MEILGDYPVATVRVACRYCNRRGRYRLETLIAAYGASYNLTELLAHLSSDCRASLDRTGKLGCRGPYFPDLGPGAEG